MRPGTTAGLGGLRRAGGRALRVLGGLLLLLGVVIAFVAYQAENLVHGGAVAEARRFGARIGRQVTVGPAHVSLGAELSVQLDDVRVAAEASPGGQEGPAAEPLFEVAAVRVRVSAWSILRSLGRDVEVRSIEARGPVIRLVRGADGALSPALTLEGGADLSVTARAAEGSLRVTADLDAGAARAWIPGRLDKAAGAPLALHARVERAGAITTVSEARLALAGATVAGHARSDADAHRLTAEATTGEIDTAALARTVPGLGALPAPLAGVRVHAAVAFSGDPRDLPAAYLHLGDLDVSAPFGRVTGTVDLRGLSPPRGVIFDLRSDALDLDGLAPGAPAAGAGRAPVLALDTLEVRGKLHVGRLHARGLDARDLDLDLALERGALTLPTLRFTAFSGLFTGSGSHVDLAHGAPAFALRARVEHVDLAALTAARGGGGGDVSVSGRLDATVSLDGAGVDLAAVGPSLAGTAELSLDGAHLHGKHTMRGTIINPLIGKIAEKAKKKHPVREIDTTVEHATVALRVAAGKVTTTAPLTARTEEGTLTMDGSVGPDHALALTGSVVIPAAAIDKATKGLLVPYEDPVVKLRLAGTTDAPRIELVDLEGTVKALRGSWIHGIVRKVERAFGKE